jgi:fructuronate reductase
VPPPRLDLAALGRLAYRPRVDPAALRPGIVHLGIGAFHRAHQAVYTEDALAATGENDWSICGVTQRSRDVLEQLRPQDGLYGVLERGVGNTGLRVVGVVREVLSAADWPALSARLADPRTRIVSLTVTEKGYRLDPATGRLAADPETAADLAGRPPRTVVGQLARGLAARRAADAGPLTVLCCDNLAANGSVLRALVEEFVDRLGYPGLADWVAGSVRFPATVVDRIVPAATDADRAEVAALLGVADHGAVVAEPYRQWVIEDDFAAGRPAWERAGAVFTADVAPYGAMKLRMLNGSHSTLAWLGALAGHATIAGAVADDALRGVAARLMAEDAAPTLDLPDTGEYARSVLARFANPALRHRTAQVAADGSQKLGPRLLGTARDRLAAGAEPRWAALGVAAWMRYVWAAADDTGAPLPVADPLAPRLHAALAGADTPARAAAALLALPEVFAPDLAADGVFGRLVTDHLARLTADGAAATATTLLR